MNDATDLVCVTQNVRGFAKNEETVSDWFTGFRRRTELGQADVVMLQETRAHKDWAARLQQQHAREWGFRPEQLEWPLSFWQGTPTAAGGVAILLRPGSGVTEACALWPETWSPYFMALSVKVHGRPVTLVNIYGPSGGKKSREQLYRTLRAHDRPAGAMVVGGDFNCTLDDERDRSHVTRHSHDSPALHDLLAHWAVRDVLHDELERAQTAVEIADFHKVFHTYKYQLPSGALASSRLDRWYASNTATTRVLAVAVDPPASFSDHDAVTVRLAFHGTRRPRGKRRHPRIRYPLPYGCQEVVTSTSTSALTEFAARMLQYAGAQSAHEWTAVKCSIRRNALTGIRVQMRQRRRAHRQRRRRLARALDVALRATAKCRRVTGNGVQGLTEGMEALDLDPYQRVISIRRSLIRLNKRRAQRSRRVKLAVYAAGTPETERAFFRRFSTRQGQRPPVTFADATDSEQHPADRLAQDWRVVTQRGPTDAAARDAFYGDLPLHAPRVDLADLDRSFSEEEVRAAIEACPRGKAAGPDGIPNDWYRDHVDLLTEVLTPMYNQWHRQCTLPASFRHATIACIPKTQSPRHGLDFRPIALLDTDYKIYSRLLLNRVRGHLPYLTSPTQYGFVPGRQVHDALDIFHCLQRLARRGSIDGETLAVLLDFEKAYDTLDRDFLHRALVRLGFPVGFCAAVSQMHLMTTAEYAADDAISHVEPILNGIRQGCPLAPTLFILAVDTLYEAIATHDAIAGVGLPTGECIGATGFADDTTVYVSSVRSLQPLQDTLARFAAASGLRINFGKCSVVQLSQEATDLGASIAGFPVARRDAPTRLLGGQVATLDIAACVWNLTHQQLRARLYWAELKTTNKLQRVKLLRAVLVPKFLFVARHHWPSATVIERFQKLVDAYVWSGRFSTEAPRKKAWLSRHVAFAKVADGGLGIPHLHQEVLTLSVAIVHRWMTPGMGLRSTLGSLLLGDSRETLESGCVTRASPSHPRLHATTAATGMGVLRALGASERTPLERQLVEGLLLHVGRGTSSDYGWRGQWLVIRYDRVAAQLEALHQVQKAAHGTLSTATLLRTRAIGEDLLLTQGGDYATASSFDRLVGKGDHVQDVLDVAWDDTGAIQFRARRPDVTTTPLLAHQFRLLCDTLVFNYPALLRPLGQPEDLVLRPPTLDVWQLRAAVVGHEVWWRPVDSAHVRLGVATSTAEATALARTALNTTTVQFDSHEWLDPPTALWTNRATPSAKTLLGATTAARCRTENDARQSRWQADDEVIAEALEQTPWVAVHNLAGVPAAHRLLFHRLKGRRIQGWDRTQQNRGCPHCPAAGPSGGTAVHIFWACPQAQMLWAQLLAQWQPLFTAPPVLTTPALRGAIFGLRLHVLPDKVWLEPQVARLGPPSPADIVATHFALHSAWSRHVLLTLHTVWRWRVTADTAADLWPQQEAKAIQVAGLKGALGSLRWVRTKTSAATHYTAAVLDVLRGAEAMEAIPRARLEPAVEPAPTSTYILFFDGGSRGNPGPGGSGAVVVRVSATAAAAEIIWSAATARSSPTTTNNTAEYDGLLVGLKEAAAQRWTPLEVVGDSSLILGQMQDYRAPKAAHLLSVYAAARRLADTLGVTRWNHHLRAFNRMADTAANIAMDARASSRVHHPTQRPEHAPLAGLLSSDFAHWQESRFA